MVPNIQGHREQGKETEETALELLTWKLVLPALAVFGSWYIFRKSSLDEEGKPNEHHPALEPKGRESST